MQAVQDKSEVSIQQYLDVLRRRWVWVVIAPVVLVGLSLASDLRAAAVYQSSTQLLLQAKQSESILSPTPAAADPARAIQNEIRIINSRTIKQAVTEAYGKPVAVNVAAGGDDDVLILSATAGTAEEAAERANIYAQVYQSTRLQALVADIAATKKVVQQQIDDFQAQVDDIDAPVREIDDQILVTPTEDPRYQDLLIEREAVKQRTDPERNAAQSSLDNYKDTLNQLQLTERLNTTGGVQILNPASTPSEPISPTPVRNALQALAIGLFLGVGMAFVRDQLDDSLRTSDDLKRAVKDTPNIGLVPLDTSWSDGRKPHLVTIAEPMSAAAEAYRGLRTTIQYAGLHQPVTIIQVTSSGAGEGKTTLLANMAVAFAQAGKRVAVVGLDLRKPRMHQFLKVDGSVGFTSVLLGDLTLEDALQTSPVNANIDVLAAGPRPPNPSELLSLDRTAKLIATLGERYSVVFVDSPPVLPVTDALVLSRCVDATIFVAAANQTTRRTARHALDMLYQVESPILGTVLNGVAAEDSYGSFYEYYGHSAKSGLPFVGRFSKRRFADTPKLDESVLPADYDEPEQPGGATAAPPAPQDPPHPETHDDTRATVS